MTALPRWIKLDILITVIVAAAIAAIVAISYGSGWLVALLFSIPFVAFGVAVVAGSTSLAGLAALRLVQRRSDISDINARLIFTGAIGLTLAAILLLCWLIQLSVSSQHNPWPFGLLELLAIFAAWWCWPGTQGGNHSLSETVK